MSTQNVFDSLAVHTVPGIMRFTSVSAVTNGGTLTAAQFIGGINVPGAAGPHGITGPTGRRSVRSCSGW